MAMKNSDVARRSWNLLRFGLLWTRKGGVLRRRLMMDLRLVPKFLKGLGHSHGNDHNRLNYKEREFSFDETPIFHIKMHRPASMRFLLPCITPQEVDFDYDFYMDERDESGSCSTTCSLSEAEEEDKDCGYEGCDEKSPCPLIAEEGIDSKAEKFIADFYQQMKLQRQKSYLEYTEMINRGSS